MDKSVKCEVVEHLSDGRIVWLLETGQRLTVSGKNLQALYPVGYKDEMKLLSKGGIQ